MSPLQSSSDNLGAMRIGGGRYAATALIGASFALTGCGGSHSATTPATRTTTSAPASASASSRPAPTKADAKFLEVAVQSANWQCLKIATATGALAARATLAKQVGQLIAVFRRVNPDAPIPGTSGTTRRDVSIVVEQLNNPPPAPPCAPDLAHRLSQATGVA